MSAALVQLIPFCLFLFLLQGLAAIPWIMVFSQHSLRQNLSFYGKVVGIVTACGLLFAFVLESYSEPSVVTLWGRFYASILMLQLGIDLFVLTFSSMLRFWPKGGAVALAAFQEGVRQPMFWMLTILGSL